MGRSGNASAYSEDGGITWVRGGDFPATGNNVNIAFGNHRFVAVTIFTSRTPTLECRSIYSDDGGITWNLGGTIPQEYEKIIYDNGRFISSRAIYVVNKTIPHIIYSKDGITWTSKTMADADTKGWHGLGYGNGRAILLSGNNEASQTTLICACTPLIHSHLS